MAANSFARWASPSDALSSRPESLGELLPKGQTVFEPQGPYRMPVLRQAGLPDGVELAQAKWWSRDEFDAELASGALLVPPSVSIARRLIEDWYGGPLVRAGEAWR